MTPERLEEIRSRLEIEEELGGEIPCDMVRDLFTLAESSWKTTEKWQESFDSLCKGLSDLKSAAGATRMLCSDDHKIPIHDVQDALQAINTIRAHAGWEPWYPTPPLPDTKPNA